MSVVILSGQGAEGSIINSVTSTDTPTLASTHDCILTTCFGHGVRWEGSGPAGAAERKGQEKVGRWSSNPSEKCLYERPTRGTVCGTMRGMCGADAGCLAIDRSQFKNNCFTEMCSSSEEGSYLRLIDICITQL